MEKMQHYLWRVDASEWENYIRGVESPKRRIRYTNNIHLGWIQCEAYDEIVTYRGDAYWELSTHLRYPTPVPLILETNRHMRKDYPFLELVH